jgi:hypothetical protein
MFLAVFEVIVLGLFLLVLKDTFVHYKKNKAKLHMFLLALAFVIIFENANLLFAKGGTGSYTYYSGFHFFIGYTPIAMSVLWAVLIYAAMHFTDRMHVAPLRKPFIDALMVLLLNLTFEIVLTKQGIRTWVGYLPTEGWFGAPADYLIAVLLMTFTFSFLFRYFTSSHNEVVNDASRALFYFLMPVFAYLACLFAMSAINITETVLDLSKAEEVVALWLLVILFAVMYKHDDKHAKVFKVDKFTTFVIILSRLLPFCYVSWSVSLMGLYKEMPMVPIILGISLVAEVLLYMEAFPYRRRADELEHY